MRENIAVTAAKKLLENLTKQILDHKHLDKSVHEESGRDIKLELDRILTEKIIHEELQKIQIFLFMVKNLEG